MSENSLESLLKPSLSEGKSIAKSYSSTAHFFVGWFGGPLGASLFSIINLRQMGIAERHKNTCLIFFVVSLVAMVLPIFIVLGFIQLPSALVLGDLEGTGKIAMRLFGVLTYGLFFLAFKRYYSASDQLPIDTPSSWKVGIICALIGGMVSFGLILLIGTIHVLS